MATNLTVKTKPIILKYAKQGMPGRTGPSGEPGKDATNWTVSVTMEGIPSGTCRVRLYKDGVLNADETHYAAVYVMQTNRNSFALSAAYSHNVIGTYTFQYTGVRAVFVVIYDDSFMENVLTAQMAQMIRGRDLKLLNGPALSFTAAQWRVKGAAGTVNTWTTGSSYDNSTLENGDLVCIIGAVSDQLDGSGNPIGCMIIGQAQIAEGGSAASSVSVVSRALFVGQQGAKGDKGDKGDRGEPGQAGTSVPWGGITGNMANQDDLVAALAGKVSKTGDTMTGNLVLSGESKMLRFVPADTSKISYAQIYARNNERFAFWQRTSNGNGNELYLLPVMDTSATGNHYYDILTSKTPVTLAQGGTGASTAAAARANLEAAAEDHTHTPAEIGAVKKTGDTMTGALHSSSEIWIHDNSITYGVAPSSDVWGNKLVFGPSNNSAIGIMRVIYRSSGENQLNMSVIQDVNGTATENYLRLNMATNGTGSVSISHAPAWRSALGLTGISIRPDYQISTTDLTAGTSSLTTNKLYFVYS